MLCISFTCCTLFSRHSLDAVQPSLLLTACCSAAHITHCTLFSRAYYLLHAVQPPILLTARSSATLNTCCALVNNPLQVGQNVPWPSSHHLQPQPKLTNPSAILSPLSPLPAAHARAEAYVQVDAAFVPLHRSLDTSIITPELRGLGAMGQPCAVSLHDAIGSLINRPVCKVMLRALPCHSPHLYTRNPNLTNPSSPSSSSLCSSNPVFLLPLFLLVNPSLPRPPPPSPPAPPPVPPM
ncbi:unnamed protein product [Closterium sp. Naga37s-1]|nr:unnamed protein product [Closterium sp. Naga37s-1]